MQYILKSCLDYNLYVFLKNYQAWKMAQWLRTYTALA